MCSVFKESKTVSNEVHQRRERAPGASADQRYTSSPLFFPVFISRGLSACLGSSIRGDSQLSASVLVPRKCLPPQTSLSKTVQEKGMALLLARRALRPNAQFMRSLSVRASSNQGGGSSGSQSSTGSTFAFAVSAGALIAGSAASSCFWGLWETKKPAVCMSSPRFPWVGY